MLDLPSTLSVYLSSNWTETNPRKEDVHFVTDEIDPNAVYPQVLIVSQGTKYTWVTSSLYRVEHECTITTYLRPPRFDPTTIAAARTTFRNMQSEIDRILRVGRYTLSPIRRIDCKGWSDIKIVTGRTEVKEPVFAASQKVVCIYYEGGLE